MSARARAVLMSSTRASGDGLKSSMPWTEGSASSWRRHVWYLCCVRQKTAAQRRREKLADPPCAPRDSRKGAPRPNAGDAASMPAAQRCGCRDAGSGVENEALSMRG